MRSREILLCLLGFSSNLSEERFDYEGVVETWGKAGGIGQIECSKIRKEILSH